MIIIFILLSIIEISNLGAENNNMERNHETQLHEEYRKGYEAGEKTTLIMNKLESKSNGYDKGFEDGKKEALKGLFGIDSTELKNILK